MDESIAIKVGRGLRAARLRASLTQAEAAEAAGLSPEVYGRMERSKLLPSLPTLTVLCRAFRTSLDEVMGLVSQPT
ncbi:helix-turn-helix transcriptional regulator [Pyxidicoccus sp. 3LG]